MYPTSFDSPNRTPLDFNTDRTVRGVADASSNGTGGSATVPPSDTESLLGELGLSDLAIREVLSESSAFGE